MGLSETILSYIKHFFRTDQKTKDQKLDQELKDTFPASDPSGTQHVSSKDDVIHPGESA